MNIAQSRQTGPNSDHAARTYSAHVDLSKKNPEIAPERSTSVRLTVEELEASGLAPSAYTVLVSRLENRSTTDKAAVQELVDWIGARLPRISEQARRRITGLAEYKAAGLTPAFDTLGRQISERLSKGDGTPALLVLLKHPVFSAYMKDQQVRVAMYGPRGMMRAS
jgi:hypothetical protein